MYEKVRRDWERLWTQLDREASHAKDPQAAVEDLAGAYSKLTQAERSVVDAVLAEWTLAADVSKRFGALSLVRRYEIISARPALHSLANRLANDADPGAPYLRNKVRRILGLLDAADHR